MLGCAGMTPQRVALNSLQTIRDSVVSSLKVFNAGYQAGQFTEAQRTQVGALYTKYLAADKVAAEALLATASPDAGAILANATVAAGDLIRFVQSLKGAP